MTIGFEGFWLIKKCNKKISKIGGDVGGGYAAIDSGGVVAAILYCLKKKK